MTTIRRPSRSKRRWICASKCAILGIVSLLAMCMYLASVILLYRRVPSTDTSAHHLAIPKHESLDTILARSRKGLGKKKLQQALRRNHQDVDIEEYRVERVEKENEKTIKRHFRQVGQRRRDPREDARDEEDHNNEPSGKVHNNEAAGKELPDKPVDGVQVSAETGQATRVTDKAYIADYAHERGHPSFRTQAVVFPEVDNAEVASLQACSYVSDNRILTRAECARDVPLTVYNSQPFPRTWCGKIIAAHSAVRMDEPCHEPVRLFPVNDSPVSGEGMPPITITSTKESTTPKLEKVECDIPCQQQVGMEGITRFIEGTEWKVIQTYRPPALAKEAQMDGNAFRKDVYYSTTSFGSSVPLSSFSFENYNLFDVPAVKFNDTLPSASYLADNTCSPPASKRHKWAGAVARHYPVAYYGKCSHNTDLPKGMDLSNRKDRVALNRKHRFNLAFEVSNDKDYITELIWDAFESGSLPVVLGPSNIESHFPPNSFINAGRFQYWDELGKYVEQVGKNQTLWESYHKWRKDPAEARKAFQERYSFTKTDSTCRMCRWAFAKQYGLGWDHDHQTVREPALSRKLCVDTQTSLIASPFFESYVTKSDGTATRAKDSTSCNDHALSGVVDSNGFKVERSIEAHDGVTDLIVSKIVGQDDDDVILRLEFDVANSDGAFFRNPHTVVSTVRGSLFSSVAIQDNRSKVTVLANWKTDLRGTKEGTIEVVLHGKNEGDLEQDEKRRIRVIVEDKSNLHDKLTEYFPSSYGKIMIMDFVDPLELFYDDKKR